MGQPLLIVFIILLLSLVLVAAVAWNFIVARKFKVLNSSMNDALESMPHGFVVFDSHENLQKYNALAIDILPELHEEAGHIKNFDNFLDFVFSHKSNIEREGQEFIKNYVSSAKHIHDVREIVSREDRTFLVQATYLKSRQILVFLTDVTDLKTQEARALQTQKMEALGQLAGGVAHDFNNVLSIILGYARMAEKHVGEDDRELAQALDRIKKAGERGAGLTKRLLLFGKHRIVSDCVLDVSGSIADQETLLKPLLDTSTELKVSVQKGLYAECTQDDLSQVIMNLVINARDAMPEGGSITIEASRCDSEQAKEVIPENMLGYDYMVFSVSDTGVGMDKKTIEKVFEPFFTTKEQGKGTGLGMSTVYGIVKDLSGYIDISSVLGQGTKISVYLPLSDRRNVKAITLVDSDLSKIKFHGYTAVVAEDEPDLLALICATLEDMGMEVIPASNGAEALMKQDEYEGDIDLLLTDVVMPELNGVKLAELLQAVREETKVVFISGFPKGEHPSQISLPDDAILLAKPLAYERLAAVLKTVLDEEDEGAAEEIPVWQEVRA